VRPELVFVSFRLKLERMLLFLLTQKFHYFLSLQMKIVMKNLSMLTPTLELQRVHVSLQTLQLYLLFMLDYSFFFSLDLNLHVLLGVLGFFFAAFSSMRSNGDQATVPSEEDESGTSEVSLYPYLAQ